jgi:hypothetical protein
MWKAVLRTVGGGGVKTWLFVCAAGEGTLWLANGDKYVGGFR